MKRKSILQCLLSLVSGGEEEGEEKRGRLILPMLLLCSSPSLPPFVEGRGIPTSGEEKGGGIDLFI